MDKEADKSKVSTAASLMHLHTAITVPSPPTLSLSQLSGFGLSILEGVDPNSDNFVSAGIITTRSVLVGCLLRLEPNLQTKVLTTQSLVLTLSPLFIAFSHTLSHSLKLIYSLTLSHALSLFQTLSHSHSLLYPSHSLFLSHSLTHFLYSSSEVIFHPTVCYMVARRL